MNKKKNEYKVVMIAVIFIASLLIGTQIAYTIPFKLASLSSQELDSPILMQSSTSTLRVAIYSESNTSHPAYASIGLLSSNITGVQGILQAAGYQVTPLNVTDILHHKLMTASFDVFVMVDSLPRESITNLVKEFWLGGGGILSLDSAISYICYAGIIPPESTGHENYNKYWTYGPGLFTQINVTTRHPITEAYHISDTVTTSSVDWADFNWTALQTTRVAKDLIKLGTKQGSAIFAPMVALDPSLQGGRVVQLPCSGNPITPDLQKLIVSAVSWLVPHPKAHILYDLSHRPHYGIDPWDSPAYVAFGSTLFSTLRDALVNRSYTFDKLYPSASGNFTASNLVPYDMLIVCLPEFNFTATEVSVVTAWINNGGGLLAMGDNPSLAAKNNNLNYLLSNLRLKIENVHSSPASTYSYKVPHPTLEGCTNLYINSGSYVNHTTPAYTIWGTNAVNTIVGGQSYGAGRVILTADINWVDDGNIATANNYQYAINIANWLTASKAKVLIYVDNSGTLGDPNLNFYRGPVAQALNALGLPFYLTFLPNYFNQSLTTGAWPLVIVDNIENAISNFFPNILNYMKDGGHLILSTWQYSNVNGIPLFNYLGFTWKTDFYNTPRSIYIWNSGHAIFRQPNHYGATNISSTGTYGGGFRLCANVTIYSNATAIAGLGKIAGQTNATIVLSVSGRAITNTMLLTLYTHDTDDSTYQDNFELWENEIIYMYTLAVPTTTPSIWFLIIILVCALAVVGVVAVVLIARRKRKKQGGA